MKRLIVCLVVAACCVGTSVAAETRSVLSPEMAPQYSGYVVQPGDSLWRLADRAFKDPWKWKEIKRLNPFLDGPHRVFEGENPGEVIVVIKPGETLVGLDAIGVLPRIQPSSSLIISPAHAAKDDLLGGPVSRAKPWLSIPPMADWSGLAWFILLLAPLAVLAFSLWKHVRALRQVDPVTSGPAMVEGGIQGGIESPAAADRFQQIASEQIRQETGARVAPAHFTILERIEGRGYGTMQVQYRHQPRATRILNGERVYQARVRMQDGQTERVIYMLQGCGNELRFGSVLRYLPGHNFRFEPLTQAPAAAAPTPVAATPSPSAEMPMAPARPAVVESVRFELRPAKGNKPASVNVVGTPRDGTTIESSGNVIAITFGAPSAPQGQ